MAEAGGLDAGELVREATRRAGRGAGGGAGGLDLALGLQVCEVVAGAGAGAAGAAAGALQRALKGRSPLQVRLALALTDLLLRECGAGFLRHLPAQAFFSTYMNMVNNIRFTHAAHDGEEWLEVLEVALQYPAEWAACAAPLGAEFPVFQALAGHLATQKDLVALRAPLPPQVPGGGVQGERGRRGGGEGSDGGEGAGLAAPGSVPAEMAAARRLAGHLSAMVLDAQRQVGKSFQHQITVNSDVIQDLCSACARARGTLSDSVQRAVSGSSQAAAIEGVALADIFALTDEIDTLLPQCGWVGDTPPKISIRPGRARPNPAVDSAERPGGVRKWPQASAGSSPFSSTHSPGVTPGRSPRRPRKMRSLDSEEQWVVDAEACLALVEQKLGEGVPVHKERAPRPGMPLLVLDLDSTLVDFKDFKAYGEGDELAVAAACRPFLHEFLERVREHFDVVLWSRSTWEALQLKLSELGHLDGPEAGAGQGMSDDGGGAGGEGRGGAGGAGPFRYIMVLDRAATLDTPVRSVEGSEVVLSSVKPLRFIWDRFPGHYGPHNTVHVDDVQRNFLLNPQNGLLISPWQSTGPGGNPQQQSHSLRDRELEYLLQYLVELAQSSPGSWEGRDHSRWRQDVLMSIAEKKLAQQQIYREKGAARAGVGD